MTASSRFRVLAMLLALAVLRQAAAQGTKPSPADTKENAATRSGEYLLRQGKYADAMSDFERALAAAPGDTRARQGEVRAAVAWAADEARQQHGDASMTILTRALKELPEEPDLLMSFGLEAIAMGQFSIAEQALEAAAKVRPKDATVLYAQARLALEEQHLPEAEARLKAYLALRPRDATAYYGLGHLYAMEQRNDEARVAFQRSLQLQPGQTASTYELGQLALNSQRNAEARIAFEKVLARDPHHAGALTGMGELALRDKDYARAERFLAAAEQSDPAYRVPHYYRGLALAKLGRWEEAEQEMRAGDSRPHAAGSAASSEAAGPDAPPPQ